MKYLPVVILYCIYTVSFFPSPVAAKKLYIRLPGNEIYVVQYHKNERHQVKNFLRHPKIEHIYQLPFDVQQERRYRHFPCFQQFLKYIDDKGILIWSPLSTPERWGDNRLNQVQAEDESHLGDLVLGRLAEVCLRGFYGEKCEYYRCNLVHLTPLEKKQVHDCDYFIREDGGHNVKICPAYMQGQCNDPGCNKLHIDFEYPRLLWYPRE